MVYWPACFVTWRIFTWLLSTWVSISPTFSPCKCRPTVLVLAHLNPILKPLPHFTWKYLFRSTTFTTQLFHSQYLITQSKNFQELPLRNCPYFAALTESSHAVDTALQAPCRELYFAAAFCGHGASPRTVVCTTMYKSNWKPSVIPWLLYHTTSLEIYPWSITC